MLFRSPKKACSGGSYQFWIRVHGRTGQVLHQIRLQKNIPAADIQPEVPQRREKQRLQSIGVTLYAQDCNTGPGLSDIRTMPPNRDRKSTRLNSSHLGISYAVFCLKKQRVCRTQWVHSLGSGGLSPAILALLTR